MPPFMGVSENPSSKEGLKNMKFQKCIKCGNVQLGEILPPEVVYQNNHNIGIIGNIWKNHYKEFSNFIKKNIHNKNKTILEISDPSAKIASKISNLSKTWYIVEPNPNINSFDNIIFIKNFFDKDFKINDKIDIIIHSHFFEHTYNPSEFLLKCNKTLTDNGEMFFDDLILFAS